MRAAKNIKGYTCRDAEHSLKTKRVAMDLEKPDLQKMHFGQVLRIWGDQNHDLDLDRVTYGDFFQFLRLLRMKQTFGVVSFLLATLISAFSLGTWAGVSSSARVQCAHGQPSSKAEYLEAVARAKQRIWILQTWLPGLASEAQPLAESGATDKRILLASFKPGSQIYSRVLGRHDVNGVEDVKTFVRSCSDVFRNHGETHALRYNYGHHPGWIAVVDDQVFWGPTPVQEDNHTRTEYFHRAALHDFWGGFWIKQFELLWNNHSHDWAKEREYNDKF